MGAYSFRRPSGLRAWDNDLNVVFVKDLDWVMRSTFQASNAVTVEEVDVARNTARRCEADTLNQQVACGLSKRVVSIVVGSG